MHLLVVKLARWLQRAFQGWRLEGRTKVDPFPEVAFASKVGICSLRVKWRPCTARDQGTGIPPWLAD